MTEVPGTDEAFETPRVERPRWWRRRRTWLLLAFAWLTLAVAAMAMAALDLRAGRDAAERARALSLEEVADGGSIDPLRAAYQRFDRAHLLMRTPPVASLRLLPVLGRQVTSVTALSGAAARITEVGIEGIEAAREILDRPPNSGLERIDRVSRLGTLASRLESSLATVDLGPERSLLSPLSVARARVNSDLEAMRSALMRGGAGATSLARLLQGPKSYLVFAANNAEMRAGTGMFLQVGRLVTGDGRFRLTEMGSVNDVPVPPGAVALQGDFAARWGWLNPQTDWRNLMLSPRFPASAELAVRMWLAAGREAVDGVLVLDPVALSAIVTATGPVSVDDRRISGADVVQELLHDQYVRRPELTERDDRREELAGFAAAAIQALDENDWKPAVLARGLADAAGGRHVLAWAKDPEENEGWQTAGVGGELDRDSLMVTLLNRGGNKLDPFMSIETELTITPKAGHAEGELRVKLRNNTPPGEVPYITGPHYGLPLAAGEYLGLLTVSLPGDTESADFEARETVAVAGPDGATRVIGYELRVLPGEEHIAVLRFRLPLAQGALSVEPSARIPPIEWRSGGERWEDRTVRRILW